MAMPQCCYLAKGAKRPSHTTNTIKFDRIPFDPCNSIKRFDLSPFDLKNSTYLQPPIWTHSFRWKQNQIRNLENTHHQQIGLTRQVRQVYYSNINSNEKLHNAAI